MVFFNCRIFHWGKIYQVSLTVSGNPSLAEPQGASINSCWAKSRQSDNI